MTHSKEFCHPSKDRDLKFTGYVNYYKILPGSICGLILKNKMAAKGVSLSVMKQCVNIFPLVHLEQNILWVDFSNLQNIFIITKI